MIVIYSTDTSGNLYTDPKQRAYITPGMLQEKALAVKISATLDNIARAIGYNSFDSLRTYTRCRGVTEDTLQSWILSGNIIKYLSTL